MKIAVVLCVQLKLAPSTTFGFSSNQYAQKNTNIWDLSHGSLSLHKCTTHVEGIVLSIHLYNALPQPCGKIKCAVEI
uniref:Uncharacterized protein n=1 Tax=Anguilla anguilla TaxID=7936 RepID=A0A0E9QWM5_ANGAN